MADLLRPAAKATLHRWREVIAAVLTLLVGLWLMRLGGWLLVPFGGIVTLLAVGWGVIALRRIRFLRGIAAPGMVEVDEGQVGYLGPNFGGFVALADLVELRLTDFHGARQWRLSTSAGDVLSIPVDAAGSDKLYDVFATLPGINMARVTEALDHRVGTTPLWTRPHSTLSGP